MNCIKVKRNNLLNSIYSFVPPCIRFEETLFVNFFTHPELSSSLYVLTKLQFLQFILLFTLRTLRMCLVKTNATECLFYSKVWLEIRPVAKLVHYYVCQEIFTVIQLKKKFK